ncbi:hypothetical protein SCA6_008133 [Theobroma cacao]
MNSLVVACDCPDDDIKKTQAVTVEERRFCRKVLLDTFFKHLQQSMVVLDGFVMFFALRQGDVPNSRHDLQWVYHRATAQAPSCGQDWSGGAGSSCFPGLPLCIRRYINYIKYSTWSWWKNLLASHWDMKNPKACLASKHLPYSWAS